MRHLGTKRLETKRLTLRRLEEADAEELYEGFVNQEEFLYYTNKRSVSLEDEKRSLAGIAEKYKDDEYYNWLIVLKESGRIVGRSIWRRIISMIPSNSITRSTTGTRIRDI